MTWAAQLWLLFIVTFWCAHSMGIGGKNMKVGVEANIIILFCIASAVLFRAANIEARLRLAQPAFVFHTIVWVSALSWSLIQNYSQYINLNAISFERWPLKSCIIILFMAASAALSAVVHCTRTQVECSREVVAWTCAVFFVGVLWCLVPSQTTLHLHHWQLGFAIAIFFRRPRLSPEESMESALSKDQGSKRHRFFTGLLLQSCGDEPVSSFCAQAMGIGIFVSGTAISGFGAFFHGLPECIGSA